MSSRLAMQKQLLNYSAILFLMLAIISQPFAAAQSLCTMPMKPHSTTDISVVDHSMKMTGSGHSLHTMHQNATAAKQIVDQASDSPKDHSCCDGLSCSVTHCNSASLFLVTFSTLIHDPLNTSVFTSYQNSYLRNFTNSLFRPPIVG